MSERLLHEDERKNLEESFGDVFLERRDVSGQLVEGGGERGAESDAEHRLEHGGHLVFDGLLHGPRQHADASEDCRVQGRGPPLVGVFF